MGFTDLFKIQNGCYRLSNTDQSDCFAGVKVGSWGYLTTLIFS